jgi:hypothetical protein
MSINRIASGAMVTLFSFSLACHTAPPPPGVQSGSAANTARGPSNAAQSQETPGPLPDKAFKAEIKLIDPPLKLRGGQKETVSVKIKNASDLMWWSRGGRLNTRSDNKFYIAVGNRWLKADGSLLTNMDGRYGLPKDLAPGEETQVPLQITAPKEPGEYTLEVDMIQEQVAWFSEKGSVTAKTKITVMK